LSERGLIYVAVYPVAVFKVKVDEAVNDVYAWEHCEEITIVFWRREVFNLVIAALAIVGLLDFLDLTLGRKKKDPDEDAGSGGREYVP
jgi:hypothetical protein